MYYFLIILNAVLFCIVILAFVMPQRTLFFVKNREKRKRFPYAFLVLVVYLVLFFAMIPLIDNTPEVIAEREAEEQERIAEIQQQEAERSKEINDSILRSKIDILNENESKGALNNEGPTSPDWRAEQLLKAQRDSLNLIWVEYQLDNKISIKKGSKEYSEINKYITGTSNWIDPAYKVYFGNPTSYDYDQSDIRSDAFRLQELMNRNSKEAVRLNQKFNGKIK